MKTFTVKVSWDPENDMGLSPGPNAPDEENFPAFKIGPLVLIAGPEHD